MTDQNVSVAQLERIAARLGPECSERLRRLIQQARSERECSGGVDAHQAPARPPQEHTAPDDEHNWTE